jgi:hypothetical protein
VRRKNGANFRLILPGVLGEEWTVRAARGIARRWSLGLFGSDVVVWTEGVDDFGSVLFCPIRLR